jgi:S-adenosylhomocysteine hydrolase
VPTWCPSLIVTFRNAVFKYQCLHSATGKNEEYSNLSGKVAVVTGGNGAIGRGIAIGLAEAGASVAILGRDDDKNQRVFAELKAIGVRSIALKIDLTDRAAAAPDHLLGRKRTGQHWPPLNHD